jgi:transposase
LPTAQALALALAAVASARAQTTVVVGERRTAALIRELADELLAGQARLKTLDAEIEQLADVHPDGALIHSLPGMGARLAAAFLAAAGNIHRFASGVLWPPQQVLPRCCPSPTKCVTRAAPPARRGP